MDYNFTASVREGIRCRSRKARWLWTDAIDKFYKLFHPIVEEAASVRTEHKVGERELGIGSEERQTCFREVSVVMAQSYRSGRRTQRIKRLLNLSSQP